MKRCIWVSCVLASLIAWLNVAEAKATQEVEVVNVAGTFLTSRLDANADGQPSSWCTVEITGKKRSEGMQQCVNEDVFTGVTPQCPGGVFEVDASSGLGGGTGVRTFRKSGDQLYLVLTRRYLCTDAAGNFIDSFDEGVVIGGTGKLTGATGSYRFEYTGRILYFDTLAQPPQYFGSINGIGKFVVQTP